MEPAAAAEPSRLWGRRASRLPNNDSPGDTPGCPTGKMPVLHSCRASFEEFVARCGGFVFSFRHDAQLFFLIIHQRIWRNTLYQKNVTADGAARSDYRFTAKHGRVGINRDVIFQCRMALAAFFDFSVLVLLKAARAER